MELLANWNCWVTLVALIWGLLDTIFPVWVIMSKDNLCLSEEIACSFCSPKSSVFLHDLHVISKPCGK